MAILAVVLCTPCVNAQSLGAATNQPIKLSVDSNDQSNTRTSNGVEDPRPLADVDAQLGESLLSGLAEQAEGISSQAGSSGSPVQTVLTFAAIGLIPMALMTTTCYVRLFVVLGLLRQAIGAQQLPSNQIIMALSFFVTILVMTPIWQQVKTEAIDPAYRSDGSLDWRFALEHAVPPVKNFMTRQISMAGNEEAVYVFYRHANPSENSEVPNDISEAPLNVILPAFLMSELKVAFLLGFQIFLPFLILDLVVSTMTVSMGMVMLPPSMVSLPLKLILFVMVDGWNLVIGMLLQSFGSVA
ncbi:MAG: flagellar type III secretion system pore protein FliP [Pirellulaceae bacterium]